MKTLTKEFTVQADVTAASVGSGDLEVLSSPSIMAWMENVSYELCQNHSDNDETTVGIEFSMKHLAP
ncbi:MAG: thioesterase family protein, partial [Ruoffia tabacinasalis]